MRRLSGLICLMAVLGMAAATFGLEPILMGDFENGSEEISSTDIRWDGWMINLDSSAVTTPAQAATRGAHSLKWVDQDGGSWMADSTSYPYGGTLDERLEGMLNPPSAITVDVTAIASEVPGEWATLNLFYNAAGGWGFDDTLWQNVIIDGMPHTYTFYITDQIRTVILDSIGGWGCNLGFCTRTADATPMTLYIDNIWIWPDGPDSYKFPHDPSYDETTNVNPEFSDITLKWKAATVKNPVDPNFLLPVNPDIVDEYVFLQDASSSDPNLYYIGATGDPGLTDPNSSFGTLVLPVNSLYRWAVVEIMNGHVPSPAFTTSSALTDMVDPNNIIGPIWTLQTRTTTPEIHTQPVSTRFGVNDASASFTVGVDPGFAPSYQWYYSPNNNEIDAADTAISSAIGGNTDTVTIATHNKAYQAYYYCKVSNSYTVTGGGTFPDVYSNVVSLVVERKVAEYLFEGNLNDTSGMGLNGVGVGSPAFAAGAGGVGQALSLNGASQYVEVTNGFPRADLFTNVEGGAGTEIGFGGGLDIGSITCWAKLNATTANQVSPIVYNSNAGWPHTEYRLEVQTDAEAANTNLASNIWGVATDDLGNAIASFWMNVNPPYADPFDMAGDGQWHMLALTWDNDSVRSYIDGNLLANWSASANEFTAWDATTKIGFDGTNYFGGAIDNLRVYNYELTPEAIENEAYLVTGVHGCLYDFTGSSHNSNQLGSSYCKIDLADFADLASAWLNEGFYPL